MHIVRLLGSMCLALGVVVVLCEAGSRCAAAVAAVKADAGNGSGDEEAALDDAHGRSDEGEGEDEGEVSERAPVLDDDASRSTTVEPAHASDDTRSNRRNGDESIVAEMVGDGGTEAGAESEAIDSRRRERSDHLAGQHSPWWYNQVLRVSLCCNVFNLLIVLGLPLFGWWGLSTIFSCSELRRSVCKIEDCPGGDGASGECGEEAPWPQIFWACIIATPCALLSTMVFLHAACTGRIDAHDCSEPASEGEEGGGGPREWGGDGDDDLFYQSGWDGHHANYHAGVMDWGELYHPAASGLGYHQRQRYGLHAQTVLGDDDDSQQQQQQQQQQQEQEQEQQEQGEAEDDTALGDQEGESESRQRGASREGRRPAVADAEEDDVL
jgi:hypothetical protein